MKIGNEYAVPLSSKVHTLWRSADRNLRKRNILINERLIYQKCRLLRVARYVSVCEKAER